MKRKLGLVLLIAIAVVSLLVTACGVSSEEQQAQIDAVKAEAKTFIQTEVADQVSQIPIKPGPQGIAGAVGPTGAVGLAGAKGEPGAKGAEGAVGPQGTVGAQGVKGQDGSSGGSGGQGPQGVAGFPPPPVFDVKLGTRYWEGSEQTSTTATVAMSNANTKTGLWAALLTTGGERGAGDTASIFLTPLSPMVLGNIQTIEWATFSVKGYPPHVDIKLDLDGNGVWSAPDDALVFEYAYNPEAHSAIGQPDYGVAHNVWFSTFADAVVNQNAKAWATRGAPGPLDGSDSNFVYRTFAQWKGGVTYTLDAVQRTVNANSKVLLIEIEVDNWIPGSDVAAFVDDIVINGKPVYWTP